MQHVPPLRRQLLHPATDCSAVAAQPGNRSYGFDLRTRRTVLLLLTLLILVFLATSGGLVLAAGGAAIYIYSTQKQRPAVV